MLLRADNPLNIAGPGKIYPRLLMLPCPDNLGDHILDGSQDPTCGAENNNDVLDSGSRFGRLPWNTKIDKGVDANNQIEDGLGRDFKDAYGNRLWYAVSKNLVPTKKENNLDLKPLNLHRLAALQEDWLEVTSLVGSDKRIAAVILSPGSDKQFRLSESILITISLNHNNDKINPTLYFEKTLSESNADKDGFFVQAHPSDSFNDILIYISIDELLVNNGTFINRYRHVVGISDLHNAPIEKRPLALLRDAVVNWRDFFGFYPLPAANSITNLDGLLRHCATYNSGTQPLSISVTAASITVILPASLEAIGPTSFSQNIATLTITSIVGFLLHDNYAFSTPTTVVVADISLDVNTVSLSRYARVSMTTGTFVVNTTEIQGHNGIYTLSTGITIILNRGTLIVPSQTPLNPSESIIGWFPEHYKTTMIAKSDNTKLTVQTTTAAGFLGKMILTNSSEMLTIKATDKLIFSTGSVIKLEKDYSGSSDLYSGVSLRYASGTTTVLTDHQPSLSSYKKRHFVVLMLADIVGSNYSVYAPAVLYPWNEETNSSAAAITRDNWHPWPPCFDARNMKRQLRTFIEDQPIHYAVAGNCHHSGDNTQCGLSNGITLTINNGASIALPKAFTLTHSYTTTIQMNGINEKIIVNNGKAQLNLTLIHPVIFSVTVNNQHLADFYLPANFKFSDGVSISIQVGTKIIGRNAAYIKNIPALLIYSPAPLSRSGCIKDMRYTITSTVNSNVIKIASQKESGADLTNLCQWLDSDENADGDLLYEITAPTTDNRLSTPNDYFILFGGQLILE
jgi:hypothetical protein